jgi:hypothetical protein
MRIAGQRRGETYPERVRIPPSGAGLIQDGWDQPISAVLALAGITTGTRVPRDAVPNPMRVTLPGVVPGNTLVVDAKIDAAGNDEAVAPYDFAYFPVVSFDGGATYSRIVNATGWHKIVVPAGGPVPTVRCFAGVTIPDGAAGAIVEIVYTSDTVSSLIIFGTAASITQAGCTLYAAEHSTTSQPGPFTLTPFP